VPFVDLVPGGNSQIHHPGVIRINSDAEVCRHNSHRPRLVEPTIEEKRPYAAAAASYL
jgi:hypothetical protein